MGGQLDEAVRLVVQVRLGNQQDIGFFLLHDFKGELIGPVAVPASVLRPSGEVGLAS
ncbi:hypothetical protein D3C78_1915890 [compost metagenome]